MLPAVALAIWLLLTTIASSAGDRLGRRVFPAWLVSDRTGAAAVERFGPTFDTIVVAVVASMFLVHIGAVATLLEWPGWTVRACLAGVGLVVIVVGNIMPRTRPNWIAGLRTKHAMRDPDVWRTTHRRFGALLVLTGVAVVAVAVFATPYALLTGVVGALVSAIVATISAQKNNESGKDSRSSHSGLAMVLVLILPIRLAAHQMVVAPPVPPSDVIEQSLEVTSSGLVMPGTLAVRLCCPLNGATYGITEASSRQISPSVNGLPLGCRASTSDLSGGSA